MRSQRKRRRHPGQTDSSALSLSIAMVLAAGVRKANIKSALRVSRDLN